MLFTQIRIALQRSFFELVHRHFANFICDVFQIGGGNLNGLPQRRVDQRGQVNLGRGQLLVDVFQQAQVFKQLTLVAQRLQRITHTL